jgi:MFS family permease
MATSPTLAVPEVADLRSLGEREQTRNLLLVAANTGLSYLASPVLYVGVVHAALGEQLGVSATFSNLPASAYLIMSALPVVVAWAFPRSAQLKPILASCYAALAVVNGLMAALLFLPAPTWLRMAVLVLQGGVVGGTRTVAVASEFEILGRAVCPTRRGTALGLAYGIGPILAIAGALASQLLLGGRIGSVRLTSLDFPDNFATLFAATVPIMALAAFLSSRYVLPECDDEPETNSGGPFRGLRDFLGRTVVRRAMLTAIIVLAGYQIISNLTLYTRLVLDEAPAQYAGYQNMVRFACKAAGGIFLGWLLARTGPRVGLFVSMTAGLAAVLWAGLAPGTWFLVSFGLLGAGELFGIHVTNYILCCAPPTQVRRYMAFAMLALFPAAPAGLLFGAIADGFPAAPADGFRLSFLVAALFIGCGIALTLLLPAHPQGMPGHKRG